VKIGNDLDKAKDNISSTKGAIIFMFAFFILELCIPCMAIVPCVGVTMTNIKENFISFWTCLELLQFMKFFKYKRAKAPKMLVA